MRRLKNFTNKHDGDANDGDYVKAAIGKYSGMNEDALIEELMKKVREGRADGSFDDAKLNEFVALVSPHLSAVQCEKLSALVAVINSDSQP